MQTVPGFVHPTVSLTHVNTRTDHVVVIQDGRVLIVPLVIISHTIQYFTNLRWRFNEIRKDKSITLQLDFQKLLVQYICNVIILLVFLL